MIRPMHWLAVSELSIPAGDAWLSDAERGRQATMRFTKRRTEYRLRRYAGKRAVSATGHATQIVIVADTAENDVIARGRFPRRQGMFQYSKA